MNQGTAWLAWLPDRPSETFAAAAVRNLDGTEAGNLVVWTVAHRPHPEARRVDPAAIDPDGPPAAVSLIWPARDSWPLFDDPSVVQAVRTAAHTPHLTAASTFTADPTGFAGSLVATDPALAARWPAWWSLDPFARLGPRYRLIVGAGLLSNRLTALGPGTQRRAGAPWPSTW